MRPTHLALPLLALACTGAPAADPASPAEPGPATTPGGAEQASAGSPAGAASLAVERLDADPECDAVVPAAAPAPVQVRLEAPSGGGCVGGVPDGTGAVALGARDTAGDVTWRVHGRDGTPGASFAATAPLLSQPSGWHALSVAQPPAGAGPVVDHLAVSPSGDVVARERVTPDPAVAVAPRWSLAADPAGGSVVAVRSTLVAGNHWSQVVAHRFDAAGAARWPGGVRALTVPSPSEPLFLGAGVPQDGDALVVAQHSAYLDVAWLDAAGVAAGGSSLQETSEAVVGGGLSHVLDLAPLLDGSLAVGADGTWRRTYAPRAGASGALPAWLAARAGAALRTLPGGAGYALLPRAGGAAAACEQAVDLVSPSGRLCGRVTIREPSSSACAARGVEAGWDGTLVAQSMTDACTFRWWPALLGR